MNIIEFVGFVGVSSLSVCLSCFAISKLTVRTEKKSRTENKLWWKDNGGRVGIAMFKKNITIQTYKQNVCEPESEKNPKMYRLVAGVEGSRKITMVTEYMTIVEFVPLIKRFQSEDFDIVFNDVFFKRKNKLNKNPTFTMYGE